MRQHAAAATAAVLLTQTLLAQDPSWQATTAHFWSQERRDAGFRQMAKIYNSATVNAGGRVHAFGAGKPLALEADVDAYMKSQRAAGLLIIQDNKIRLEKYSLGLTAKDRWASFSVAKSVTSTLAGAALKDGFIRGLDDKITDYLHELKGSVYENVTVRHLLTMTTGVKWNEDYNDPNSDVVRIRLERPAPGTDAILSYMRRLTREAPAGTKWAYKTGETNLIGVLIRRATGKPLSAYLSEKIWRPYGMEMSAHWDPSTTGQELGGCCLSMSLRDYARFGQFILDGAKIEGRSILPDAWLAAATTKQADIGIPGRGYGYQWWTTDDGGFQARGIFGQSILIDPKRRLVIVTIGSWPTAVARATLDPERAVFWKSVQSAVDAGK